jgi:hypothetical protein
MQRSCLYTENSKTGNATIIKNKINLGICIASKTGNATIVENKIHLGIV